MSEVASALAPSKSTAGDKRLALAAVIAFYGVNGRRLTLTNDEAHDLIIDVATGRLDSAEGITRRLRSATEPRRR